MTDPGAAAQSWLADPRNVADLLLRIGDSDPAAWDEIHRRYGKLVFTTVQSFRLQEADELDAVQMTWLRLAENAPRMQFPERLGEWLATTARRECLRILRQNEHAPGTIDVVPDTVTDPSVDPEQRVIDDDTKWTLRKLVDKFPQRSRALLRALFLDNPRPYFGIAEGEPLEGDRTGSHRLDNLLDKAEQALREKLEPKVTSLRIRSAQGTGDAQLDDLLHRADAALRASFDDHGTAVSVFLSTKANGPRSGRRFTPPAGS